MKYYIFGGDGFVGRYLSNALIERGENVVVGDILSTLDERINKKAKFINVDIRDKSAIRKIDIMPDDLVINLAANQYHTKVPKNRKEYFYSTNYVGTKNILEVMEEKNCMRYLMFTTDMTYGKPQ